MGKLKELIIIAIFVPLIILALSFYLGGIFGFLESLASSNSECEPKWVMPTPTVHSRIYVERLPEDMPKAEEICKSLCYNWYEVTSFKLEKLSFHTYQCYCDTNNCNPQ